MWSRKTIGDGIEKMKGSLSPSEQEKKQGGVREEKSKWY